MPYVQASFQVAVQPHVTLEMVRDALGALQCRFGASAIVREGAVPEACVNGSPNKAVWFDGKSVGLQLSGDVSYDTEEVFNHAAMKMASISAAAFETTFAALSQLTEDEEITRHVRGADQASVNQFRLDKAFARAAHELESVADLLPSHLTLQDVFNHEQIKQAVQAAATDGMGSARSLQIVLGMAQSHLEDIETGLQDGTYEPGENLDVGDKRTALAAVTGLAGLAGERACESESQMTAPRQR